MNPPSWLWAAFTLAAAAGQTLRNAAQHDLTPRIGSANATFVRFLFGFPFALGFLAIAVPATGVAAPAPSPTAWTYIAFASVTQVLATALMLQAIRENSFVVATALAKTEALQIVGFGLAFLGDPATPGLILAVAVATVGVALLSGATPFARGDAGSTRRSAVYGLASASAFALSTVAYRGGVLALGGPSFIVAAAEELVLALTLQTTAIVLWLTLFDRAGLRAIAREWRVSLAAGFIGALSTLLWFLAFALESAARVRTLGLAEVVVAQILTHRVFAQRTTAHEMFGIVLVLAGVALALNRG